MESACRSRRAFSLIRAKRGERQLSVFRSWEFDAAVIVLFDDGFRVWRAARVPVDAMQDGSRFVQHVSGYRVLATDAFLDRGEDWTERLRAVEQ